MGQRISYFRSKSGKTLIELIIEHFEAFRKWYLATDDEFNGFFGSKELRIYLRLKPDFPTEFEKIDKHLIDELTSEFIGNYCDWRLKDGAVLELFGPLMSRWRYNDSTTLVANSGNQEFLTLWNYLMEGRSLKNKAEFDSYTNEYRVGFLSHEERGKLKKYIETFFAKDFKLDTNILSKSNLDISGLEFVLDALNEVNDFDGEIITGIE